MRKRTGKDTIRRSSLSLRSRLTATCTTLLGLSLFLALALIAIHNGNYQVASRKLEMLRTYRNILLAANAISKERGPTNTLLGGDYAQQDPAWAHLRDARAQSNAALDRLLQYRWRGAKDLSLASTRTLLLAARHRVDAALKARLQERTLNQLQAAITGMFDAVDAIKPLINEAALASDRGSENLADEAGIGRKLFEIRDYAGRLGSILTPYIALRTTERADDQQRLERIYGRIQQLWELTKPDLASHPELAKHIDAVERTFFVEGIALIAQLNAEARTGKFSVSTSMMTERLVPTFAPLERARDAYLDDVMNRAQDHLSAAKGWLVAVGAMAAGIIVIDIMLILGMEWFIFNPLLQARRDIVSLADESMAAFHARGRGRSPEVEEVFHAIDTVRTKLTERASLLEQLKLQATTDGLTGLLNRRILEEIGGVTTTFEQIPMDVGMILIDIDHFKRINDTYGHGTGDRVLKSLASILRQQSRSTDLVIRFGGEEFAIVLPSTTLQVLVRIAEGLRAAIADHPIDDGRGGQLTVTASFGVAVGRRGHPEWTRLIDDADKALYAAKQGGRNRVSAMGLPGHGPSC